jgi:hypothetical protein
LSIIFRELVTSSARPSENAMASLNIDVHEGDQFDGVQIATWVKQAAVLPGWAP